MNNLAPTVSLKPVAGVARWAVISVYASIAASVGGAAAYRYFQYHWSGSDLALEWTVYFIAGASFVLTLISAALVCRWMYRATINAELLVAVANNQFIDKQAAARSSVIAWFIPFANLVLPYVAMTKIWRQSNSRTGEDWQREKLPVELRLWWTFWVISLIGGPFITLVTYAANCLWLAPVINVGSYLLAGVLLARIIGGISERQTHRIHMQRIQSKEDNDHSHTTDPQNALADGASGIA